MIEFICPNCNGIKQVWVQERNKVEDCGLCEATGICPDWYAESIGLGKPKPKTPRPAPSDNGFLVQKEQPE